MQDLASWFFSINLIVAIYVFIDYLHNLLIKLIIEINIIDYKYKSQSAIAFNMGFEKLILIDKRKIIIKVAKSL